MILFKKANDIAGFIEIQKQKGVEIGFVPTMGALHNGHITLIENAKKNVGLTVCSIFVNPTQFNNAADFEKYPITITEDIRQLEKVGCDILFLPSVDEVYPAGLKGKPYELGQIENIYEGEFRPGHFQGVAQVLHRLFDIVKPDTVFLGQKDFQQCIVVKRLVEVLKAPIEITIIDTLRESTGLAMSSRNMRLTPEQRENAAAIYKMLQNIRDNISTTSFDQLERDGRDFLLSKGFSQVDYVSIAETDTLQHANNYHTNNSYVVLVAAFLGDVRLIDNIVIPARQ